MHVDTTMPSIFDLAPLETGGVQARIGFCFQDHVAAGYCLGMLENPGLHQVWCEAQDDVTLIWGEEPDPTVEFVQVKSNEFDQLWSVALLCQRKAKKEASAGGSLLSRNGAEPHLSVLEKSLRNDRVFREQCRFRIVTSRDVKNELSLLTLPLGHPDRGPHSGRYKALRDRIPKAVQRYVSDRGRNFEFWLQTTLWEVLGTTENLQHRNHMLLDKLMERESHFLSFDQRNTVYAKLLSWVQKAAISDPARNREAKQITRSDLEQWLSLVAQDALHPVSAGSSKSLRQKMVEAGLPDSAVESATEQRRSFLKSYRSTAFLDLSSKEMVVNEVRSELSRLTSQLNSGVLGLTGNEFHSLCLSKMEELGEILRVSLGRDQQIPRSFLDGCMYDMANRCTQRFTRECW